MPPSARQKPDGGPRPDVFQRGEPGDQPHKRHRGLDNHTSQRRDRAVPLQRQYPGLHRPVLSVPAARPLQRVVLGDLQRLAREHRYRRERAQRYAVLRVRPRADRRRLLRAELHHVSDEQREDGDEQVHGRSHNLHPGAAEGGRLPGCHAARRQRKGLEHGQQFRHGHCAGGEQRAPLRLARTIGQDTALQRPGSAHKAAEPDDRGHRLRSVHGLRGGRGCAI
jgi:hypothetical protein